MLFTLFGHAQQQDQKVGLVLSGGGAKGFAHIGALKVIDSLGLKVDYIAGTSMGAVIGALYASGYSGKQLDSIFKSIDFNTLINDVIPRASKSFYERDNNEKYAVVLPFNNFKIHLPSAISRGQNVFNLLSRLTIHVSDVEDFKNLPIPFFCIATNVETGEQLLLDRGSLAQAIAASGAFPSLFQPVIIDDQILIDGGVVNNYPIEELKAKGMDIIIGVDVQDDLADREDLQSAPEILLQINNFRTIRDMKLKSKQTDIYIKPDIRDFNVISFSEGAKIIKKGELAAKDMENELLSLAETQSKKVQNKFHVSVVDSLLIKKVNISGPSKYTRSYILGQLKIKPNEKLSYERFEKGVNNLVGTNNFKSFLYRFESFEDGYNLRTELTDSDNTTFIKLGIHFDDLYKSAAVINLTKKTLLVKNDIISIDFILGDNLRYNLDYFIDKGFYWSIGLKSRFNDFSKNINASLLLTPEEIEQSGVNKIDIKLRDFTNQFYVQTLFRRDFSLRLGAEHKHLTIFSETFSESSRDETFFEKSDFFSLFGTLKFDTFDNKYFPKKGFIFDGDFHLYLSSSDFNNNFSQFSIAKAQIGYAFSLSNKFAVKLGSQGGFKVGEDSNNSLNFALGGYGNDFINNFISFYGYDFISLTGNSFVKGSIQLDYEWYK
ncbi:MAG: patatin-like phospholipase family protein, partial [Bacteroidia bacterium]|nr:patatin-like phospholipase family protein [Bacteroidia bacterium]